MNGKIVWVKEKYNTIGGGKFFHISVSCLSAVFEIVIEEEYLQDYNVPLAVGNIVHGEFKLVGKIVE